MSSRSNEAVWDETRNRWEIRAMRNGVRKKFTSSKPGRKGKLEAERKADAWIDEIEEYGYRSEYDPATTCDTLLTRFEEHVKATQSTTVINQTSGFIRRDIRPMLGPIRIGNLTEGDLQDVIDMTFKKKKLAQRTLTGLRSCMTAWLKWCRKRGLAKIHPEDLSIPKAAKRPKKTVLQPDSIRTLFSTDTTLRRGKTVPEWYIHAFRFMVATGWRPGETIGLKTSYLRQNGKKVVMDGAINYYGEETEGKNGNARRTAVLPPQGVQALQAQAAMLKRAGIISPYIFPWQDGTASTEKRIYAAWKKYCASNGIPPISLYELRHTYVSVNKEMPAGLKRMAMGHSKDMDTEGVYGHQMLGDMEKVAMYSQAALDEVLGKISGDQ